MRAIDALRKLPLKQRLTIAKSKKDFVIIDKDLNFTLTDDLERYKNTYIKDGGHFAVISAIKNDL